VWLVRSSQGLGRGQARRTGQAGRRSSCRDVHRLSRTVDGLRWSEVPVCWNAHSQLGSTPGGRPGRTGVCAGRGQQWSGLPGVTEVARRCPRVLARSGTAAACTVAGQDHTTNGGDVGRWGPAAGWTRDATLRVPTGHIVTGLLGCVPLSTEERVTVDDRGCHRLAASSGAHLARANRCRSRSANGWDSVSSHVRTARGSNGGSNRS
jgi:hypothetical protein